MKMLFWEGATSLLSLLNEVEEEKVLAVLAMLTASS